MRKLSVFNSITLDGYFTGHDGDLSWAHANSGDPEFQEFVAGNAQGGGMLLFGRVTYEMMIKYWPTPEAKKNDPEVAEGMNRMPKAVFSRTLKNASWENTTVLGGDPTDEVRKLKKAPGPGMVILGSGSIIALLAGEKLIDEYQVVVVPVVLGDGRTMFEGLTKPLPLTVSESRTFKNGNVFLRYEPK